MNTLLSMIGKIIAWVLFIAAFAAIGLATDNPAVMIPVYGIGIIIVLGAILLVLKSKKKHSGETTKTPVVLNWIEGIFLLLFTFIVPAYVTGFGALYFLNIAIGITILFTILMIGLGSLGVYLINVLSQKIKIMSLLGYLIIIFLVALPALAITPIDASSSTLGVLYFVVMVLALSTWGCYSKLSKAIKGTDD